jgi:hypothetical protein
MTSPFAPSAPPKRGAEAIPSATGDDGGRGVRVGLARRDGFPDFARARLPDDACDDVEYARQHVLRVDVPQTRLRAGVTHLLKAMEQGHGLPFDLDADRSVSLPSLSNASSVTLTSPLRAPVRDALQYEASWLNEPAVSSA